MKMGKEIPHNNVERKHTMNCLCNFFDNEIVWLIIIALLILFCVCGNNGTCGGCGNTYPTNNGCGCGCGC